MLLGAGCTSQQGTGGASATGGSIETGSGLAASCVGPYLNDQPPSGVFRGPLLTVSPGDTVTIFGHWYTSTCNDTGGHDPLVPLAPVHLTLTLPGWAVKPLGMFTPGGEDMGFSTTVQVPADATPGIAYVRDDREYPATYEFKVDQ